MDQFPQMLYRAGGAEQIHGGSFATLVVDDAEQLEAALADGWAETTPQALELAAKAAAPTPAEPVPDDASEPTRAEIEQKATELGIKFDGRTSDKKLLALIEAATQPGA